MVDGSAIAVVGIACRTPGATDPRALWELLRSGSSAISEVPEDRRPRGVDDAELAVGSRYGAFLEQIDRFDCGFFGISPREAAAMDPQQRLMLELCWEALEDAQIVPEALSGSSAGVFVGSISSDYADLLHEAGARAHSRYVLTGTHRSLIANRVSYTLGLRGPSMTVDSGQSSSLVAVHLACESLRRGESALALACGVHLNISSASALAASSFGGLSPDGRSFVFDARANGYVRGEGGGVVVLKALSDALADGDSIYGVILASAVNNDGGGDGLTAPSQLAQEEVLRLAYLDSGIEPTAVQYVELHGTGTELGDRVEAAALGSVLGAKRPPDRPLAVGSIKTNIGHLEGAAGIVGLIKTALSIANRELPPTLNFQAPSPELPLDALGLHVQQELGPWSEQSETLSAGVSSFGVGGTNCHVVLQALPETHSPSSIGGGQERARSRSVGPLGRELSAWTISARDDAALRAQAERLAEHVERDVTLAVTDIACTLTSARQTFARRAVVLGEDHAKLASTLRALARGEPAVDAVEGAAIRNADRGVVFVFPGQGSQWQGMACELWDASAPFAASMHSCEEALSEHVEWSLREVVTGASGAPELDRIDVVQPVLFAVMVSLARQWGECGVHPAAVVGHSQGEIAAAHIAGGLSLGDAARVVALRSRLLTALVGQGSVVSVVAPVEWVGTILRRWDGRLSIGGINGSGSSVGVVGDKQALAEFLSECEAQGVRAREVPATVASHSPQVEPLREELLDALAGIVPCTGSVPFYSTVSGTAVDCADLTPEYWYRNMREPVQFERALRELHGDGLRAYVEISPHPLLTVGVQQTIEEWGAQVHGLDDEPPEIAIVGTLSRDHGGPLGFVRSLAEAWVQGVAVDWEAALALSGASRAKLPTYPFQRRRHWFEQTQAVASGATDGSSGSPEVEQRHDPLVASLEGSGVTALEAPGNTTDPLAAGGSLLRRRLVDAPPSEHLRIVTEIVRAEVAAVAGETSPEDVDSAATFKDLGLDSRAAVELRNRLRTVTGLRLTAALMFDYPTPVAMAAHLLRALTGVGSEAGSRRHSRRSEEPLAIVGMSCRLPGGVNSPEELWDLVSAGGDAISDFPTDRGWDLDGLYNLDSDTPGTVYTRQGGFLYDAAYFDAAFFGISPREALAMDPQQRLFLESCWEAVEHAGIDPLALKGSDTGVFAGISIRDYNASQWLAPNGFEGHNMTGSIGSLVSGRVAYSFGLQGPAITIDTACSSSLVTLHLACLALRNGDCSLALAGGVTVLTTPGLFAAFSRQRALASDGRCKAFSDSADGTGWGEGVGVLMVERLSDAQSNGHRVLALVRGSAVNQDGASNGLTAPNGLAQQQVIGQALSDARLSPQDIDVVEAHGTGTELGDPIEAQALLAAYGQHSADRPLRLGSVKSNIGHTQAAAGVAGVIKMVMAMRHGTMPKTLHVDRPSREVDWSAGAVSLLTEEQPWRAEGGPRRAGISSYGISGTNAHVILEQPELSAVDTNDPSPGEDLLAWVLSGRSEAAVRAQAGRLNAFVSARPELSARDVARSVADRSSFEYRAVVLGSERDALLAGLAGVSEAESEDQPSAVGVVRGSQVRRGSTAFLFTGQGAQRIGMGDELYSRLPVFKTAFDDVCAQLDPLLDRSLRAVVFGEDECAPPEGGSLLDRTQFAQTGLFALEVALFRQLDAWGVRPDFLIGHSVGELAAAHLAGVFSLEDACRLVAARGRLMDELPAGGGMLAVQASEAEIVPWLAERGGPLALAAVNGPEAIVLSGDEEAVLQADRFWTAERNRKTKLLAVSHAFHSSRMDVILAAFEEVAESVSFSEPTIPIVSNLTGQPASAEELCSAHYWVRHVRETVQFAAGVQWLVAQSVCNFIELGPDGVLSAMARECLSATGASESAPIAEPLLRVGRSEYQALLEALARSWVGGVGVDWKAISEQAGGSRVELPTYAFQRERYWLEMPQGYWLEQGRLVEPGGVASSEPDGFENEFWEAVEREDVDALVDVLGVEIGDRPFSMESMLPSLSRWRKRHIEQSVWEKWLYRVRWKPAGENAGKDLQGLWPVVFSSASREDRAVGSVIEALEARGASTLSIEVDLNSLDRERLAQQLNDALARDRPSAEGASLSADSIAPLALGGMLSLLAWDEEFDEGCESMPRGLAGTLLLAQVLGEGEPRTRLSIVTRSAVSVGSADLLECPLQGMTWGMGRVMGLENPECWGGLIDLPSSADDRALERLCHVLAQSGGEDELAIRSEGTFARRLVRAVEDDSRAAARWAPHGTVLITGGTGAIGAHLARWLARNGAEHILLVARRGSDAPGARELESEVTALGAKVTIAACDVSDRDQLQALIATVPDEFPLSAVFHAAGVLDDAVIDEMTVARVASVSRPKVNGAWQLHELTKHLDLNAFVMFSSIAATLGSGGQAGYAAANAFLGSLAEHRRGLGLVASTIAWGAWAGEGMAAGASEQLSRRGIREMEPERALAALQHALDRGDSSLTIAALDWERYALSYTAARARPLIDEIDEAQSVLVKSDIAPVEQAEAHSIAAKLANLSDEARQRFALDLVRTHAAGVLGFGSSEEVEAERAFKELGLDSLAGVDLRHRLEKVLGLRLSTTVVFDYPTPSELARYLVDEVVNEPDSVTTSVTVFAEDEPIAIVGMGCRFPGDAHSPERLWDLVARGADVIGRFPSNRGWDLGAIYDPELGSPGTSYTCEGGFLYSADEFDASFFGISPREALGMSPQQRMLLEVCWEALEKANIDPRSLKGSHTGVFIGESFSDYGTGEFGSAPEDIKGYLGTGNAGSIVSGRVAYTLGLEGPAVTVDTACSSSLVALHFASGALRRGECSLALVGGATVMAAPSLFIDFSRHNVLARDGRCKSFSEGADGTSWSEGIGVVAVERLSDARRNGHEVLALVRGSAINQDGASNGLTAPSGPSQRRVIERALADAGLSAGDVDAVEAHGTGTKLGDPIEAHALLATYGQDRPDDRPLWLGSLKSNIGHTQAAAGVAGMIKMVMAFKHEQLPRTLHVDVPSEQVDWSAGAVSLLRDDVPWRRNGRPRRVGVSSFGISGTNAHVILEEPPPSPIGATESVTLRQPSLDLPIIPWVLSARSDRALCEQAERLRMHLENDTDTPIADIGLTLASRARLEHRAVVLGGDRQTLLGGLQGLAEHRSAAELIEGVVVADNGPIAFMFTGQGAQRAGMGSELYGAFPIFTQALDEACELLDARLGCSLRELMFFADGSYGAESLHDTEFTQAALFALEVALFRLVESCGVRPDYLIGHSVGELVAAHVAGVFSLEDACTLVAARGRLMGALPSGGAMAAIQASEQEMLAEVEQSRQDVALAAVNGPNSVVISGEERAVLELSAMWSERGRKTRRLRVSHAFHSAAMDGMLEEFGEIARRLSCGEMKIPVVSNLTGREAEAGQLGSPDYWVRHVRETVRFADGVNWLAEQNVKSFLELGPDGVLSTMVQECARDEILSNSAGPLGPSDGEDGDVKRQVSGVTAMPLLRAGRGEVPAALNGLANVWVVGGDVDWARLFDGSVAERVGLPTYAFQRERFWLDSVEGGPAEAKVFGQGSAEHPLLGAMIALAEEKGWLFTGRLSLQTHAWLADHTVLGRVLLPGTAFLELALYAGSQLGCELVKELTLQSPLTLPAEGAVQLQVNVGTVDEAGVRSLSIHSRVEYRSEDERAVGDDWVCHAMGSLGAGGHGHATQTGIVSSPDGVWPPVGAQPILMEDIYDRLASRGLTYGPLFQGLTAAWRCDEEIFAEVELPSGEPDQAAWFGLHPAMLDAALHAIILLDTDGDLDSSGEVRLPFSWSEVELLAAGTQSIRVRLSQTGEEAVSLTVADATGNPMATVGSLTTRRVSAADLGGQSAGPDGLFYLDWKALSTDLASVAASHPSRWALIDADDLMAEMVSPVGVQLDSHADVASLGEGIESGGTAVPDMGLLLCTASELSLPGSVQAGAVRALGVVQKWLEDERLGDVPLGIVTLGAVAAQDGEDSLDPAAAAVWGLVRSAQSENPGRLVLVDLDREPASWDALATALAGGEPQLAIRNGELLTPQLIRADSQEKSPVASTGSHGTILITGGTGGLGALLARHLVVEHGVTGLVLASRAGEVAPGAAALRDELTELGADVQIVACDVSDRQQVEAVIASIPAERPLRGVVHAAGLLEDGVISSLTPERLARVLAPKVDGAWHLHELTSNLELDMFVLFSSVAATLGGPGQGNYAAANAFLETLAAHRRTQGLPAVAMAWGPWVQTVGMTSRLDSFEMTRMASSGMLELDAQEGLRLFDAARAANRALVVLTRLNMAALRAQARTGTIQPALRGLVRVPSRQTNASTSKAFERRLVAANERERDALVGELVGTEVAAVLGYASSQRVEQGSAFKALGFDSLTALELRNRLGVATGLQLPATLIFDHPTPGAVAQYLLEKIQGDRAGSAVSPDAELANLERRLSEIASDEVSRAKVAGRLHAFLQKLDGGEDAVSDDEDIRSATAEEVIELINRETGSLDADGDVHVLR
jgi:pimaricinolide synthase PimS1